MTTTPRKRKNNFIDNKEFYAAMKAYITSIEVAKERGEPKPRIPRYIGKCFLDIAEHLRHVLTSPTTCTDRTW